MNIKLHEILVEQRAERDRFLAQTTILRRVQSPLKKEGNLISVVTGPRRAGKSTYVFQALKGIPFYYCNFDDERLLAYPFDEIDKCLKSIYGHCDTWFIDEVQNIPDWPLIANRLQRRGLWLIITGSNSHLLSHELITHLTGRHKSTEILPFSFKEFCRAKNIVRATSLNILEYLKQGGYPEVVVNGLDPASYLPPLYQGVVLKDIVNRYKIRKPKQIHDLGVTMLTQTASPYTLNSLAKVLEAHSVTSITKYLHYLFGAYVCFSVPTFSHKPKMVLRGPAKMYAYDTGMAAAVGFNNPLVDARFLETAVALSLKRKGSDFYTYRTRNNKEVDFLVRDKGRPTQLIQVCYSLADAKTQKREFSALKEAMEETGVKKACVITLDVQGASRNQDFDIERAESWLA